MGTPRLHHPDLPGLAVRGGQLARDPSTAPIDKETGKPDIEKAKIFEIP